MSDNSTTDEERTRTMQTEESTDPHERATKKVREQGLPEDNPISKAVERLEEEGWSWMEIYDELDAVHQVIDKAAYEEEFEILGKWEIAVLAHDPETPSGKRYEYHQTAAKTAEKAEERIREKTGLEVVPEKTEQVGTCKVS